MNKNEFLELLKSRKYLISDGATGTNLIKRGLSSGTTAEQWVLEQPDKITQLHRDFKDAGSDIILTSTFGASKLRLRQSGLEGDADKINQTAVQLAKDASNSETLVAGSIGPLGEMLKPFGTIDESEAQNYYADQAQQLYKAGVDLLVIETQFDLNEAKAAIRGVKSVCDTALICSFSFDRGTKTMMGVSPTDFANEMKGLGLTAIGINCGKSLEDNLNALKELVETSEYPIWFKPNAGLPKLDADGTPSYSVTPEQMAEKVPTWIEAGARIMGGCCGTSPEHLSAIAEAVINLRK